MWVIVRVHYGTTNGRTNAHPTAATCLTDVDVGMFAVTNNTDGSAASKKDLANFTGRKTEHCIFAFLSHQLCAHTSATADLAAAAWMQLNVVDQGTNWDVGQWQCITGFDIRIWTGVDDIPNLQTGRSDDVTLFTVYIVEQSDAAGAVWIVFDGSYASWNTIFQTLKVNDRYFLL